MLATPATSPDGALRGVGDLVPGFPRGPGWAFEVKWDGVRVLADTRGAPDRPLSLRSRNDREVSAAYPELAGLAALPGAVLDGEVVLMDAGVPSFTALAERMHVRDPRRAAELAAARPVTYLLFDALALGGRSLLEEPFDERRRLLETLDLPAHVALSPVYPDADELWAVTRQHGLEGVVAKRRSSRYLPGRRSTEWVKAAHRRTRTAVVGGWREETTGSGRLGAVLLGAPDADGALRYLGRAGSGLTGAVAADLRRALEPLARTGPPFTDAVPALDRRDAHWCEATVLVDLVYLARTPTGRLRHPVVRGRRDDAAADPWETA
ncbi:DNA ligase [Cellulomonas endophytica]|uniref:ATP-dependent DNA ligase n=1 Tax=Cellulomonas endophytica TaxID=2494735 RepID=UPI001010EF73|nr:DNA ligase [Cellulomonas endophytica]